MPSRTAVCGSGTIRPGRPVATTLLDHDAVTRSGLHSVAPLAACTQRPWALNSIVNSVGSNPLPSTVPAAENNSESPQPPLAHVRALRVIGLNVSTVNVNPPYV